MSTQGELLSRGSGENSHPSVGSVVEGRERQGEESGWREMCVLTVANFQTGRLKETSKVRGRLQTPFLFGVLGWEGSQDTCPGTTFLSIWAEIRPAVSYPESFCHSLARRTSRISWIPVGRKSWPCRWGLVVTQDGAKWESQPGLKGVQSTRGTAVEKSSMKGPLTPKKLRKFLNPRCKQQKTARCMSSVQANQKHGYKSKISITCSHSHV